MGQGSIPDLWLRRGGPRKVTKTPTQMQVEQVVFNKVSMQSGMARHLGHPGAKYDSSTQVTHVRLSQVWRWIKQSPPASTFQSCEEDKRHTYVVSKRVESIKCSNGCGIVRRAKLPTSWDHGGLCGEGSIWDLPYMMDKMKCRSRKDTSKGKKKHN